MKISFITPHREIDESRLKNLSSTLKYYRSIYHDSEIILVEQDNRPKFKEKQILGDVSIQYRFIQNNGVFNKAWGFNVGAKMATGDILIFIDSDIISSKESIDAAIKLIRNGEADIITPYGSVYDLTEKVTKKYHKGVDFDKSADHFHRHFPNHPMEIVGGICICEKNTYLALHGYNENFRGWGAEDEEFIIRADKVGHKWVHLKDYSIYHLYHARDVYSTPKHIGYEENLKVLQFIKDAKKEALESYIEKLPFGDENKYQELV